MFITKITTLFLLTMSSSHGLNIEVVMRGGDPPIQEMDLVDFPTYHQGTCTVRFPRDGNWATQNGFLAGGWDANHNSKCQSVGPTPAMTYKLQADGNFVAYCGSNLDYATHTGQGSIGNYFLAIDDACVLHLYGGTVGCNGVNIEQEIWTNIREKPLRNGDRLGKGEMVRFDSTTLVMQSSDGNLVLYDGIDGSDQNPLWAASDTWVGPPQPMYRGYYLRVTDSGWLELVGKDYSDGDEHTYFQKFLGLPEGSACFTVEYDLLVDDLISVAPPCV